ncbi:MAG: hypothetical protein ACLFMZ_01830 [Spirochaetaceae bacterium]
MIHREGMCKPGAVLFFLAALLVPLAAEEPADLFERIDENYLESRFEENADLLEEAASVVSGPQERAEYLWRLSRNTLSLTDELRRAGASDNKLLEGYGKGEEYADEALSLVSDSHNAYYWRASNAGRWGQTKGILNSLMKAKPMRDDLAKAVNIEEDHADSYYVLGMLYASVPSLISFGNQEYAVSYSRKAIDVYDGERTKYVYYLKLAEHLWDRKWGSRKREKSFHGLEDNYRSAGTAEERNKYYEGVFDSAASRPYSAGGVKKLSDREEARKIISWLIKELESSRDLNSSEKETLEDARELQAAWN